MAVITVFAMLAVAQLGGRSVLADNTDGRINNQVWSASGETIAVYCLDKNNNVATNFDGGLKVLNQNITEILRVSRAQIDAGQAELSTSLPWVVVGTTTDKVFTLYMLYARNDDGTVALYHFQINAGATRIGFWNECQPTGDPVPTPTPCAVAFDSVFVGFVPPACCQPVSNIIAPDSVGQFAKFAQNESTTYIGPDVEAPVYAAQKPCFVP